MKRTTILSVAFVTLVGACAAPMGVTGRADNDMLRFSAMNYVYQAETVE